MNKADKPKESDFIGRLTFVLGHITYLLAKAILGGALRRDTWTAKAIYFWLFYLACAIVTVYVTVAVQGEILKNYVKRIAVQGSTVVVEIYGCKGRSFSLLDEPGDGPKTKKPTGSLTQWSAVRTDFKLVAGAECAPRGEFLKVIAL